MKLLKERLNNLFRYRDLLTQLVVRDIKLKYRRSFLGYLWSVLSPLLIMTVMTIVFSQIFRFDIQNFAVYLLSGQILFGFMTESTTMAIGSIFTNASLIKKTYVPKYVFTLARVTSSLVNLLFSMVALGFVMLFTGVKLTPYILLFPITIIELYFFCLGLGLFLAQASVFFRDIQYIYGVMTTAWMYFTPIFYPVSILPENIKGLVLYGNPMYYYIAQFRDIVLNGKMPEAYTLIGGLVFAIGFLVLGTWTFLRNQDNFILYI